MNAAAIYLGDFVIYWAPLIITLGILSALAYTFACWRADGGKMLAVLAFFPLAFVLSVFLSRVLHWYFNMEQYAQYSSFFKAMTNYSVGSFFLGGVIPAVWLASIIIKKTGLIEDSGLLLDCTAPGLCLLFALIRISASFNGTCRGKYLVNIPLLQRLPFAVASVDASGNTSWRIACYFIEFLALLLLFLVLFRLRRDSAYRKMRSPCPQNGNVFRLFIVLFGAIEIICDSLRSDSPLMHFSILNRLNAYSAFISLAQIFGIAFILIVFIYYLVRSVNSGGFKWFHPLTVLLFAAAAFGAGYIGEYRIQRRGETTRGYIVMFISLSVFVALNFFLCNTCSDKLKPRKRSYDDEYYEYY